MVYSKRFVVVLKVDGRILREFNHENISDFESECSLLLPFNSEYTLMVKNLESRSALLNVAIDGVDVLSGNSIIVRPNDSVELTGFMNSEGNVTNKFKFIQKTEQIVKHRGDRIDDGMVRIEWKYESLKPITVDVFHNQYHNQYWSHRYPWPYVPITPYWPITFTSTIGCNLESKGPSSTTLRGSSCGTLNFTNTSGADLGGDCQVAMASCFSEPAPEEGITVKGSQTSQRFVNGYIGKLEENSHVIVIRLKGTSKVAGEKISKPIEVKTKTECPTCGNMVKSGSKYCPDCGTCVVEV